MGFNSDVDGKASMIIHCMHAAKLVVIRLILIKESNAGMNGCTTNAEVRVADGRRLHGGWQLHGGRAALKPHRDEGGAVRWRAPWLLGGGTVRVVGRRPCIYDEAVGVGADSR